MTVSVGVSVFINVNSDKVLEVRDRFGEGARVSQADDARQPNQRWNVIPVSGKPGVYVIENVGSGKVLDVESENQGADVVQRAGHAGEPRQQWELDPARTDGVYRLKNRKTGSVVDVADGRLDDDAPIKQYWPAADPPDGRQEWKLIPAEESEKIATGPLWAWGKNTAGQLGNGLTTTTATPVEVSSLTRVRQLAVGGDYSMALLEDRTVRTWGTNVHGTLGDGTSAGAYRTLPSGGPLLTGVKAIAAGHHHVLVLMQDNTMQGWGYNAHGQAGDQTTVSPRLMPVPVLNLAGVQAIAAGWHFSLALLEDTTVRAWAYNGYGQLGNNATVDSRIPVRVLSQNGEVLRNVKKISCGAYYGLALLEDGTVWAWGQGNWGQLGNKRRVNLSSAGPVLDSDGNRLGGVKDISAGPYHALALLKDNGKVVAWGHNEEGQLGNIQYTTNARDFAAEVIDDGRALTDVTAICATGTDNTEHSIALLRNGVVLGWGLNNFSQLGNPQHGTWSADPKPVITSNGERLGGITMIAAGNGGSHYLVAASESSAHSADL